MMTWRRLILESVRKILPRRVKGWLYALSVSPFQEGSLYYHINKLRELGYHPSLVVDVGAFRGEWTRNVMPIFSDATFVMVEPQADKVELLSELAAKDPQVKFVQSLLGRESKEVEFFEMESGSSIYEEQTVHPRVKKVYPMRLLDEVLKPWLPADEVFLKLDVQGAELDVLAGAQKTLENCSFILLEASVLSYNAGAPLLAEVIKYMETKDFLVFDVCDLRRQPMGVLIQLDLIFARRGHAVRAKVDYSK